MRRLNQSASWFSDISVSSDDEEEEDAKAKAKQSAYEEALQNPDRLAKVIDVSATWLDCDGSLIYPEDDVIVPCEVRTLEPSRQEQPGTVGPTDCGGRRIVRSCSY